MWGMLNRRGTAKVALLSLGGVLALAGCGGGSSFKNEPRPPVTIQLSGVITDSSVTVSPNKLGAGPVNLIISNQAHQAHTVTLEGAGIKSQVGPINPLDTGQIQQTLRPGRYTVRAGSPRAVSSEAAPATLVIGRQRPNSSSTVLLP